MAFEDLYFRSPSQGLLNLRYRPVDSRVPPTDAIGDAQRKSGRFCVARVFYKYDVQVKKAITPQAFSDTKDLLVKELKAYLAQMQPEIKQMREREDYLQMAPDVRSAIWHSFTENEKEPILKAQATVEYMLSAITFWSYEKDLCSHAVLAA